MPEKRRKNNTDLLTSSPKTSRTKPVMPWTTGDIITGGKKHKGMIGRFTLLTEEDTPIKTVQESIILHSAVMPENAGNPT